MNSIVSEMKTWSKNYDSTFVIYPSLKIYIINQGFLGSNFRREIFIFCIKNESLRGKIEFSLEIFIFK